MSNNITTHMFPYDTLWYYSPQTSFPSCDTMITLKPDMETPNQCWTNTLSTWCTKCFMPISRHSGTSCDWHSLICWHQKGFSVCCFSSPRFLSLALPFVISQGAQEKCVSFVLHIVKQTLLNKYLYTIICTTEEASMVIPFTYKAICPPAITGNMRRWITSS